MTSAPAVTLATASGSAASPATRSTDSGPEPERVTTRTGCPAAARRRAVPLPTGPAPKMTCMAISFVSSALTLGQLSGEVKSGALEVIRCSHERPDVGPGPGPRRADPGDPRRRPPPARHRGGDRAVAAGGGPGAGH